MSSITAFFTGSLPGSLVTMPSIAARPPDLPTVLPDTCARAETPIKTISKHAECGFMIFSQETLETCFQKEAVRIGQHSFYLGKGTTPSTVFLVPFVYLRALCG